MIKCPPEMHKKNNTSQIKENNFYVLKNLTRNYVQTKGWPV